MWALEMGRAHGLSLSFLDLQFPDPMQSFCLPEAVGGALAFPGSGAGALDCRVVCVQVLLHVVRMLKTRWEREGGDGLS